MNKHLPLLIIPLALVGCPGEDQDVTYITFPGQENRIDGHVMFDGMFNDPTGKVAFCDENPDVWFCSNIGTSQQTFTTSEYYGLAQGYQTCYGPSSATNADCIFPSSLNFRIIEATDTCFNNIPGGPNVLQERAIIDGVKEGMKVWDGKAGKVDVVNNGTPGTSGHIPTTVDCSYTGNGLAQSGFTGTGVKVENNAPIGPTSGKDVDDFITASQGFISLDILEVWQSVKANCGSTPTLQQTQNWAKYLGAHEMGHVVGFSHFDDQSNTPTNLMYPFMPNACNISTTGTIKIHFISALTHYVPSAGGTTIVLDDNLENLDPL